VKRTAQPDMQGVGKPPWGTHLLCDSRVRAIASAVTVITVRNPFRAAVALIVALLSIAVVFLLQRAPFVAMIQVIVYAAPSSCCSCS